MTEYNLFCYSEEYNDENSFQQKRWRAFNKEVGKERYNEILLKVKEILDIKKCGLEDFWKKVTKDQWNKLLSIPEAKDFKAGFEYISGVKIDGTLKDINPKRIEINGATYILEEN